MISGESVEIRKFWEDGDGLPLLTNTTANRREARGKRLSAAEILTQDGNPRQEETAGPESLGESLGEDQLPIARADARREDAEHGQQDTHHQDGPAVPRIVDRADERAAEVREAYLDRAYPGYRGRV